jgi:probable HAF family extracellular repeat protein
MTSNRLAQRIEFVASIYLRLQYIGLSLESMRRVCLVVIAASLVPLRFVSAEETQLPFVVLGTLPGGTYSAATDVSEDGAVVVGTCDQFGKERAFLWTQSGGIQDLGLLPGMTYAQATGVSADGAVVVGCSGTGSTCRAFRWTSESGMVDLGSLGGSGWASATAVNADGTVIVGQSRTSGVGIRPRAFRWRAGEGMQELGTLPVGVDPEQYGSIATGVDGSGQVVAVTCRGVDFSGFGISRSALWNIGAGLSLLPLCSGFTDSRTGRCAADGSSILGHCFNGGPGGSSAGSVGVVYRGDGAAVRVNPLPNSSELYAYGIDARGEKVLGRGVDVRRFEYTAITWSPSSGTQVLMDEVCGAGVALNGWELHEVQACTGNAKIIVGQAEAGSALHRQGFRLVRQPALSCPGDASGDGVVDGADVGLLLSRWNAAPVSDWVDLNCDGRVDGADLGALIASWGPCQ